MAGAGPAPSPSRRRREAPARGDWTPTPGSGWQHGPIPTPPRGLLSTTSRVWEAWFKAWWAANWSPAYLPQIRIAIELYDQVARSLAEPFIEAAGPNDRIVFVPRPCPTAELRQAMDGIGASFKGQQDRRWVEPKPAEAGARPAGPSSDGVGTTVDGGRYSHLKVVGDD